MSQSYTIHQGYHTNISTDSRPPACYQGCWSNTSWNIRNVPTISRTDMRRICLRILLELKGDICCCNCVAARKRKVALCMLIDAAIALQPLTDLESRKPAAALQRKQKLCFGSQGGARHCIACTAAGTIPTKLRGTSESLQARSTAVNNPDPGYYCLDRRKSSCHCSKGHQTD